MVYALEDSFAMTAKDSLPVVPSAFLVVTTSFVDRTDSWNPLLEIIAKPIN